MPIKGANDEIVAEVASWGGDTIATHRYRRNGVQIRERLGISTEIIRRIFHFQNLLGIVWSLKEKQSRTTSFPKAAGLRFGWQVHKMSVRQLNFSDCHTKMPPRKKTFLRKGVSSPSRHNVDWTSFR